MNAQAADLGVMLLRCASSFSAAAEKSPIRIPFAPQERTMSAHADEHAFDPICVSLRCPARTFVQDAECRALS
jgi:hypothetical protein